MTTSKNKPGPQRITEEEALKRLYAHLEGIGVDPKSMTIGKYPGKTTIPWKMTCPNGHKWNPPLGRLRSRPNMTCGKCRPSPALKKSEAIAFLEEHLSRIGIALNDMTLSEYPGNTYEPWLSICPQGHEWNINISMLRRNPTMFCLKCGIGVKRVAREKKIARSIEARKEIEEAICSRGYNPQEFIIGEHPGNVGLRWRIICPSGHIWKPTLRSLRQDKEEFCLGCKKEVEAREYLFQHLNNLGINPHGITIGAYPGSIKKPWSMTCSAGHETSPTLHHLKYHPNAFCSKCYVENRHIPEEEAVKRFYIAQRKKGYNPEEFLLSSYPGTLSESWTMICPEGHTATPSLSTIEKSNGNGCSTCAQCRPYTEEEAKTIVLDFFGEGVEFLEPYPGNNLAKWHIKCPNGHPYHARLSSIKNHGSGCESCYGNRLYTDEEARAFIVEAVGEGVAFLEPYTNGKVKWKMICPEGHHCSPRLDSVKNSGGNICPTCSNRGYDPSKPGWMYLLRVWHPEARIPIANFGITGNLKTRMKQHREKGDFLPLGKHFIYSENGRTLLELERKLKATLLMKPEYISAARAGLGVSTPTEEYDLIDNPFFELTDLLSYAGLALPEDCLLISSEIP